MISIAVKYVVAGPGSSSIVCQCEVGVALTRLKAERRFSSFLQATSDLRGFRACNSNRALETVLSRCGEI